jgi:sugar O-acyltransferase (sialic acid O-acetyltransferase NeuD family)
VSDTRAPGAPGPVVLYGAGAFARELAWHVEECRAAGSADSIVHAMIDDDPATHGRLVNDYPVMGLHDARARFPQARIVVAVGDPRHRETMAARATDAGFAFATVIHPRVERSRWVEIGEGTVIFAGTVLTTNIVLGRHVQINPGCTVAHDVVMGDFASLAPGVRVSGHVRLGQRAYLGAGATVINGRLGAPLEIGDDAVIGAAACVTKSVPAGATAVGVPARTR